MNALLKTMETPLKFIDIDHVSSSGKSMNDIIVSKCLFKEKQ